MLPPPGDPHTRRRQVHIPVFILPDFSPPSVISKPVALSFRQGRAPAVWSSDRLFKKSYTTEWTAVRARERVANSYKGIDFYLNFQVLFRAHFCTSHIFLIFFLNYGMRSLPSILASVKFRNFGKKNFLPFWLSYFFSKFFPLFFFFQYKMENRKKQEIFTKLVNLTEGNIFGRRRIPMFGKKEKYINTKTARKKKPGKLDKKWFDKNGPHQTPECNLSSSILMIFYVQDMLVQTTQRNPVLGNRSSQARRLHKIQHKYYNLVAR